MATVGRKMYKKVRVTALAIKNGVPEDSDSCPIALALRNRKNVMTVEVDGDMAEIEFQDGTKAVYSLPKSARNFVTRFDMGKPVRSFSFTLLPYTPDPDWDEA